MNFRITSLKICLRIDLVGGIKWRIRFWKGAVWKGVFGLVNSSFTGVKPLGNLMDYIDVVIENFTDDTYFVMVQ